jgi:hypothetical protein
VMTAQDGRDAALELSIDIGGFGTRTTGLCAIDYHPEGDRSFALHLQPQLDQAADGVRNIRDRPLLGTPLFDGVQLLVVYFLRLLIR